MPQTVGFAISRPARFAATRNFYGLLRVYDQDIGEDLQPVLLRSLYHGEILHGSQLLAERRRREPITYYGSDSGVALAIEHHPRRETETPASTPGLSICVTTACCWCISRTGT